MPAFHHLLVPLDGSRLAEIVLPTALGFAKGIGAQVTLLHVLERGAPQTVHGEPHLTEARAAEHYLREVAGRNAVDGLALDLHVHANEENDVAASIVDHVRELDADLTVLTPHGRGGLRRWLIGTIAHQVLQRGSTPVLLVPPCEPGTRPPFELHSLLVPLDGKEAAEAVLPLAREIARTWHAAVDLVQVVPTLSTIGGDRAAAAILTPIATATELQIEEQVAQDYLENLATEWPTDVPLNIGVLRGDPAQEVIELVRRTQPDLIMLSTHGRTGLAGLWAASVAPKIVMHVARPILMVRVPVAPAG
jgi:nucleotide-binding universal stress UspA family protein